MLKTASLEKPIWTLTFPRFGTATIQDARIDKLLLTGCGELIVFW